MPTLWERLLLDLKERLLNFETVKGVYQVPAGCAIIYVGLFFIKFVIQAVCVIVGLYYIIEGCRKIWVNRIKQAAKTSEMVDVRIAVNEKIAAAKEEKNDSQDLANA